MKFEVLFGLGVIATYSFFFSPKIWEETHAKDRILKFCPLHLSYESCLDLYPNEIRSQVHDLSLNGAKCSETKIKNCLSNRTYAMNDCVSACSEKQKRHKLDLVAEFFAVSSFGWPLVALLLTIKSQQSCNHIFFLHAIMAVMQIAESSRIFGKVIEPAWGLIGMGEGYSQHVLMMSMCMVITFTYQKANNLLTFCVCANAGYVLYGTSMHHTPQDMIRTAHVLFFFILSNIFWDVKN